MPWIVHLAETITGQVGRALDPVKMSWEIEINKADSGSVTISKSDLQRLDRRRVSPYWGSVVISYITPAGTPVAWAGGPIRGWPTETRRDLTISFDGMRRIFTRRYLERDHAYTGLSLGSIAWEIVEESMTTKPGGLLPIVHGSPYERLSPGHQRTYEHWNLANNQIDKRLTEISEVIGGPDIMFRPRWADKRYTQIEWAMMHGVAADPAIPQTRVPHWDATAAISDIESMSMTSDGSQITSRVWGTGAGEGAGTTITRAEDLTLVRAGFPYLETIISDPDQEKPEPIKQKALGELAAQSKATDQLSIQVNAASTRAPLGSWFVGNDGRFTTGGDWWAIPPGDHTMRILRASGDADEIVTLETQEGQWAAPGDPL